MIFIGVFNEFELYKPPTHLSYPLKDCSTIFYKLLLSDWSHSVLKQMFFREEKSEQLLDTRQELENVEVELKRLQQDVRPQITVIFTQTLNNLLSPTFSSFFPTDFVPATLPDFNQMASDLAHYKLLGLFLATASHGF